jgi:hypothetical protein
MLEMENHRELGSVLNGDFCKPCLAIVIHRLRRKTNVEDYCGTSGYFDCGAGGLGP